MNRLVESIGGVISGNDSSGALLQQHKSIDGEDCSSGYQSAEDIRGGTTPFLVFC